MLHRRDNFVTEMMPTVHVITLERNVMIFVQHSRLRLSLQNLFISQWLHHLVQFNRRRPQLLLEIQNKSEML